MARSYQQDRERWELRLKNVDENIARVDRKIAGSDERLDGLKRRKAALEADRVNYLRALGREAEATPAKGGQG